MGLISGHDILHPSKEYTYMGKKIKNPQHQKQIKKRQIAPIKNRTRDLRANDMYTEPLHEINTTCDTFENYC